MLEKKAEDVKARFRSRKSYLIKETQISAPKPVYIPPKNATASVRMAELRYKKKRKKRPKPSSLEKPVKYSELMTPTISERIGMYYTPALLSPRTLGELGKIKGKRNRGRLSTPF